MAERRGQTVYTDTSGREYVLDERGNQMPPLQSRVINNETPGWTEYDSSQGHCGLCGSLTCRGRCIQGG